MRALLILICCACEGPEQILKECHDYNIAGQYQEIGSLRDAVIEFADQDPGGGAHVYWCPAWMDDDMMMRANGIPEWHTGGLYLGCRELYAVDDEQALRRARHEAAHCFNARLYPYSGDYSHSRPAGYWEAVE
jgi:hypothetical protein